MRNRPQSLVLGVDETSGIAGRVFAERRERAFALAEDADLLIQSAVGFGAKSLLAFLPRRILTLDRVSRFAEDSHCARMPIGIVPIPDGCSVDVAEKLGSRLAALPANSPLAPVTLLFAESAPESEPGLFRDAASDGFLAHSRAGASAIVFGGHGNGACFKLGRAALCALADDRAAGIAREPRPWAHLPCQAGGPCLQRNIEVKAGPSALNAEIVVMLTCWGWMPTDGYIDPRESFAELLAQRSVTRALVTSFAVSQSTWAHAVAARDFLDGGGTAGELCLALNAMSAPGARVHVCIGDPEAAITASPAEQSSEDEEDPDADDSTCAAADPGPSVGMKSLELLLRGVSAAAGAEAAEATALADDLVSQSGRHPQLLPSIADVLSRLVVADSGALWRHYTGGDGLEVSEARLAHGTHACGASWWVCDTRPHSVISARRRQWVCSRCGVVGDTGADFTRSPDLEEGMDARWHLRIPPDLPRPAWGVLAIERSGDVLGVAGCVNEVPRDASEVIFPGLESAVSSGVQNLFAILVWKDDFLVVRRPFVVKRQLSKGPDTPRLQ